MFSDHSRFIFQDYICIKRGIMESSESDLKIFCKAYPSIGLLIFPERWQDITDCPYVVLTPIHKIISADSLASLSDTKLIEYVKSSYPPYKEDWDPLDDLPF